MKVLFDYSIFFHQQHGGISRYFLNLYKEFIQKEIDTKILAPLHNNTFLKDSNYKSNLNLYIKNIQIKLHFFNVHHLILLMMRM